MDDSVYIGLLGPVQVLRATGERPVTGRQRALLALLAMHAPHVVSADRLIEALWPDELPSNPANALQGRVSQLRKLIDDPGARRLVQRDSGYALTLQDAVIDSRRFEELADAGHRALRDGQFEAAAEATREALGLWRGEALEGFAHEPWATAEAARLEERRLATAEDRFAADLGLGEHGQLIGELEAFVHRHPMRERPCGQLMLALYRSGRQADALEVYHHVRRLLADELGIDPSPQLRDLERRILEQDPTLELAGAAGASAPGAATAPAAGTVASAAVLHAATGPHDEEIIGRGTEFAALASAWTRARAGDGGIVAVCGEPGIGKSHLVDALARRARADEAVVLVGRCPETEGAPPFWPWIQVVRPLVQEAPRDQLRRLLGASASSVAQIVPEVLERLPDLDVPAASDAATSRFRICDAIASLLRGAARDRSLLVVLEDLHHADPPSLDLLDLLPDYIGGIPLLLVGTYRERDAADDSRLGASIATLTERSALDRIVLGSLDTKAITALTAARTGTTASDDVIAALEERTGGNPLFLGELLRLVSDGEGEEGGLSERLLAEVPPRLRDVIARRLRRMPPATRAALDAAAVVGREAPVEWVAAMIGQDVAATLDDLQPAVDAGVVTPTEGWLAGYRFEHVLVRDAVVASLGAADRIRLHAAAAKVIDALPDDRRLAAVAHHLEQAVPLVVAGEAVDAAIAAADHAGRLCAFEQAQDHLRAGLGLLERAGADPARELSIHARRAFLYQEADGFNSPRVREAADRVRALAGKVTDAPEVVGVVYSLWAYWMNLAQYDRAAEVAEELVATGSAADDLGAVAAGHFTRGQTRFLRGDCAAAVPDLDAAARLVDDLDPDEVERRGLAQVALDAKVGVGHPFWLMGRDEEGERLVREPMERADRDGHHYASAHARLFMSWLCAVRGDAESTLAWAEQCSEQSAEHGFGLLAAVVAPFHGWATAMTGDASRGIDRLRAGLQQLHAGGFMMLRPLHLGLLAEACQVAGRTDEAQRVVDEAIAAAAHTGERVHLAELHRRRALVLRDAGATRDEIAQQATTALRTAREQGAVALIARCEATAAEVGADT